MKVARAKARPKEKAQRAIPRGEPREMQWERQRAKANKPKDKQTQKHSPKAKGKVYRMEMMVVMKVIAIQMKMTFLTLKTSQTWAKRKGTSK